MPTNKKTILKLFLIASFFISSKYLYAQGGSVPIMQFTGIVFANDSVYGLPSVYVYIPKAGRGVITNYLGYFSLPVLPNDSVVVTTLGYKPKSIIIKYNDKKSVTAFIRLTEDTLMLPVIDVYPYYSEELFKQAFLALKLPDQGRSGLIEQYDPALVANLSRYNRLQNDQTSEKYYRDMKEGYSYNYLAPNISFINPFAWRSYVNAQKRREKQID